MRLKKLKAPPIEIYATACQFVFLTGFASNQQPPMVFPLITNCCLSIELLLKTLVASENNDEFPTDHSLFRLFQALQQPTKDEIAKGWKEHCATPPIVSLAELCRVTEGAAPDLSLATNLKEAEEGFVRFRYAFDRVSKPLPAFFLSGLERVLMNVILTRHPDFIDRHPRFVPES